MTFLKICLRTLLRFIRDLDGFFLYLTKPLYPKRYHISGACKQRGICCQNIAIGLSPKLNRVKKWIIRYYEFVYNFAFITALPKENVLLFRCKYLKNKKCQIHWKRPYICRHYPNGRLFSPPSIMPGCGYHIQFSRASMRNVS